VLRTPEASRAGSLRTALGRLSFVLDAAACAVGSAAVPSYPGGSRPTSSVVLRGERAEGSGECVAWTAAAHAAFSTRVTGLGTGRWTLDEWASRLASTFTDPYERAALEAAAIDLALRQSRTTLFAVAEAAPAPVRYVVSFERVADPVARARIEAPGIELKIDVDPGWSDAVWSALARRGGIPVLDFKLSGESADHERAQRALPEALLEDPLGDAASWSARLRTRLTFDGVVTSAAVLDSLPVQPAAVNLKPARMGGVLEALEAARWCSTRGIAVYFGGMFEVGAGRRQLQALASLLCPDAPNDVAPIGRDGLVAPRPDRLRCDPDAPGYGAA
jgi:hypothetical protein